MELGTAAVLARWIFVAAAMLAFGSALFPFYAGRENKESEFPHLVRPIVLGAAIAALLSALVWIALVVIDFGGVDLGSFVATAGIILFETDFGPAWIARFATLVALIISAALWPRPPVLLALAAIVLGSEAWIGHSAVGGIVQQTTQITHLLAGGAWLGGLVPLGGMLRLGVLRQLAPEEAHRVLARFSALGVASVGIITITGIANTCFIVGSISTMAGDYCVVLIAKVALFAAMLLIASFNRYRLLPELAGRSDTASLIIGRFRWTVALEQGLGIAVLLAASVLASTKPTA